MQLHLLLLPLLLYGMRVCHLLYTVPFYRLTTNKRYNIILIIDEDVDGAPIDGSSHPLPPDIDEKSLIPRAPFYELPAGVMMGQIKIEDLTVRFYLHYD